MKPEDSGIQGPISPLNNVINHSITTISKPTDAEDPFISDAYEISLHDFSIHTDSESQKQADSVKAHEANYSDDDDMDFCVVPPETPGMAFQVVIYTPPKNEYTVNNSKVSSSSHKPVLGAAFDHRASTSKLKHPTPRGSNKTESVFTPSNRRRTRSNTKLLEFSGLPPEPRRSSISWAAIEPVSAFGQPLASQEKSDRILDHDQSLSSNEGPVADALDINSFIYKNEHGALFGPWENSESPDLDSAVDETTTPATGSPEPSHVRLPVTPKPSDFLSTEPKSSSRSNKTYLRGSKGKIAAQIRANYLANMSLMGQDIEKGEEESPEPSPERQILEEHELSQEHEEALLLTRGDAMEVDGPVLEQAEPEQKHDEAPLVMGKDPMELDEPVQEQATALLPQEEPIELEEPQPQTRSKRKRAPAKSPYFVPPPKTPKKNNKASPGTPKNAEKSAEPFSWSPPGSSKKSTPKKRIPAGMSCIPFAPLSSPSFGLIQEKLASNPFQLLIAVTFLVRTKGKDAIPTFYKLIQKYPTPSLLASAPIQEILPIIQHLGLQNKRAETCQDYARMWIQQPPEKGKRYPVRGYPEYKDGKNCGRDEVLDDEDERVGWEVGHITKGSYALDSWRIFCRDVVRGVAEGWNGEGCTEEGFEPEWMRVLPRDKELRAFLRWLWLKEGWEWDPLTGDREVAGKELVRAAMEGRVEIAEDGGWRIHGEGERLEVSKGGVHGLEVDIEEKEEL